MKKEKKKLAIGDVVFSKEHNCKVTVGELLKNGVLCDWFIGMKHHQEILKVQ